MKQILTFNFRNQLHFRINLFLAFFQFTKLSFKRLNITLRLMAYNKKLKKSDIEKIKLFYEELEMKMQRGQDLGDYADTKLGQIYANSDVHLNDIQVFGFDYDYTIANYTKETNVMTYMEGRNYLVDKMSYPKEIRDFAFNPKFSIVGLHYDIKTGYLLKLTQFSKIQYGTVYYGKQQVSQSKVEEVYPGRRISDIYAAENLKMMSDLFALPVANLISDIIEFFSEQNIEFNSNYLYIDIQNAFDAVHLDKTIHKNISANPEKYIGSSEKFISFVNAIMKSGKKMFMLTNNTHFYVNLGCEKIFAPIVDDPDSGIKHWSEIFDVIIMHSKKPDWYDAKNAFRIYDPVTASLCINTVNTFERGKIYYGGSFAEFERITNYNMSRVLYMGDNIYNDLKQPRKICQWRTVAIVGELDKEITITNNKTFKNICIALHFAQQLFDRIREMKRKNDGKIIPELNKTVLSLKELISDLTDKKKNFVNKQFGSVFRTTNTATKYFHNVLRYAYLYTSNVENFANYPLDTAFYVRPQYFAHETNILTDFASLDILLKNK